MGGYWRGLRRFLKIVEGMEDDKLPELISVGVTLPVPRHPAMMEDNRARGRKDKLCNHWCSGVLKLAIKEHDPRLRLKLVEDGYSAFLENGLDKMMDRVMPPTMWTVPPWIWDRTMGSPNFKGASGYLSTMIGAENYELLGGKVRSMNWCLAAPDNVPSVPLSCFTFSHGGKMELTMAASPHSVFRDRGTLDRICKEFVHQEVKEFLMLTNN